MTDERLVRTREGARGWPRSRRSAARSLAWPHVLVILVGASVASECSAQRERAEIPIRQPALAELDSGLPGSRALDAAPTDAGSSSTPDASRASSAQSTSPDASAPAPGPAAAPRPESPPLPEGGTPESHLARRYRSDRRYCFFVSIHFSSGQLSGYRTKASGVVLYESPWFITWWLKDGPWKPPIRYTTRDGKKVPFDASDPVQAYKYRSTLSDRIVVVEGPGNVLAEHAMRYALSFLSRRELRRLHLQSPTFPEEWRADGTWRYRAIGEGRYASGERYPVDLEYVQDPRTGRVGRFDNYGPITDSGPPRTSDLAVWFHDEAELRPGQKCPFELPEPFRKPKPAARPDASAPPTAGGQR